MKRKNRIFTILGIIIVLAFIIGTIFHFLNRRTYTLILPQPEDLTSISLSLDASEDTQTVREPKELEEIIARIGGDKRTTKEESIQDAPVNADEVITVNFHFAEKGTSTLFVYQRGRRYYIEQPYDGIYPISKEEYLTIKAYALLDFQMPDDRSEIHYKDAIYLPYGLPTKTDMTEQIGILNGDEKDKIFAFRDYPVEEFIIEYLESGLMDNPVLFRASDCRVEVEEMYLLEEE